MGAIVADGTVTGTGERSMTTVYIVTFGEYSNYRIDRVFSTKAKADAYLARCNRGRKYPEGEIEEYELDDANEDWVAGRVELWAVVFEKGSANVAFVRAKQQEYDDLGGVRSGVHRDTSTGRLTVWLYAATQEQAVKAAMERRAAWLASPESA